jgi:hypothetical protein
MPAIKLTGFTGEQPRILPRLLPEQAAQDAVNTRLDDGGLTPMRKSAHVADVSGADWLTIYRHGADWLGWDAVVNAVPGPVAQDRLYYTGDGVPKMKVGATTYDLAVPRPTTALTAALSGSGSGDVATRIYVYTHVTSLDEETEPNPVSNAVDWQPGYDVILSGFGAIPSGRGINRQRIYRSQTGNYGTFFYLIAERAASTSDFTDNIPVDALQEPLPSSGYNPPPDTMEGLIALPNGMMAAFDGRDLCFCEPYRPHAWPERYRLTLDVPIVGLGAMGTSVLVMTEGQPYMVSGTSPDSMQMLKIEQNLPCINARGIVDLGYAIAYPSHEGLIVARADGGFSIATANLFNRDAWLAYSPADMIGAQISGRYAGFYEATLPDGTLENGILLIDLAGASFLIRASVAARAVFYDISDGGLYYLAQDGTAIRRFDAPGAGRLKQYWRSKQFVLPYPENFGAIQVDADPAFTEQDEVDLAALIAAVIAANEALLAAGSISGDINSTPLNEIPFGGDVLEPLPEAPTAFTVGIYADGVLKATVSRFGRAVRLPGGFTARRWEIDVFGDVQVHQIVMAKTMEELKSVA